MSDQTGGQVTVYVGTYTDDRTEGLHILQLDTSSGELEAVSKVPDVHNPFFLTTDDGRAFFCMPPAPSKSSTADPEAASRRSPSTRIPASSRCSTKNMPEATCPAISALTAPAAVCCPETTDRAA